MSIYLNVDLSAILNMAESLESSIKKALQDAGRDLSMQTHAHILEEVQKNLHSSREKYVEALGFEQIDQDSWVISLDKSAMFIEEGMNRKEMLDDLLKSPKAKQAKDGSKYLVVPFKHNKGPTSQTRAQTDLTNTIKEEMRKRNIPYGKIEKDANGKAKTGLLHSFDVLNKPTKTGEGPGQGHGPVGKVRQGNTGIPFLQGVRVYQKSFKDSQGKEVVKKGIFTFRVASSKQKGSGKWIHPGLEARRFFDEAADWAISQWETRIVPQILNSIEKDF